MKLLIFLCIKLWLWQVLLTVAVFDYEPVQRHRHKLSWCQKQMKTKTDDESFHRQRMKYFNKCTNVFSKINVKKERNSIVINNTSVSCKSIHRWQTEIVWIYDLEWNKVWFYVSFVLVWWSLRSRMSSFCVSLCVGVRVCLVSQVTVVFA